MQPLSVHTFSSWSPTLDAAVAELPEHPEWSHDLFRAIVDAHSGNALRILLWTHDDAPSAIMAFAPEEGSVWHSVTGWLVPGFLGPMKAVSAHELLRAAPLSARIAWWRMDDPAPAIGGRIDEIDEEPTFGLPCDESFEDHWRSTGVFKDIQRSRKRCASLDVALDAPGAAEWVIRSSDALWYDGHDIETEAKVAAARYMQAQGKLFSLSLADKHGFIAGEVVLVHRNEAVCFMTFRDRSKRYAKLGVGNFLLAKVFEHAKTMGLKAVDLGGSFGYKEKWARPMSVKATVRIRPLLERLLHTGVSTAKSLGRPLRSLALRNVSG